MTVRSEAIDARQYATHYELLRAQAIATPRDQAAERDASPSRGIGLVLLLREGMPGWLKAVEAVLRASFALSVSETGAGGMRPAVARPAANATLPCTQYHDITIVLASLVLSTRHAASSSASEGGYRRCP